MEVLITGADGLVGSAIFKYAPDYLNPPARVVGLPKNILDVTSYDQCEEVLKSYKPTIVIHCAAYTNVDKAEKEPDKADFINHIGTVHIAKACAKACIPLVYISTDAVFDGTKKFAYTESDDPNPKSIYGTSKWLGEDYILSEIEKYYIIRTNWVYGDGRTNFITSALKRFIEDRESTSPIEFTTLTQISSPTYVEDLVGAIFRIIASEEYGIYHYTNRGYVHREDVIRFMGEQLFGRHVKVDEYQGESAPRPKYCGLDSSLYQKVTGDIPPHWKDSLRKYVEKTLGEKI